MTTRDEELQEVMKALQRDDPYVEKPDELKPDLGGLCFLDRNRMCSADCNAYTDDHAPTAAERCTLLVGVNTGLELLSELVQLVKRPRPATPVNIEPPFVGNHRRGP